MDKEVHGLDQDGVRRILDQANEAGIGLHISLMAGFPGDGPADAAASVSSSLRRSATPRMPLST